MMNEILIDENKHNENQLVNVRLRWIDMIENNHHLKGLYIVKIKIDSLNTFYYT
jgi:hypothetical protein